MRVLPSFSNTPESFASRVGQIDSRQVKRCRIAIDEGLEKLGGRWNTFLVGDRDNPRQLALVCSRVVKSLTRELFNLGRLIVSQRLIDAVFIRRP